jgi:hypothetical protein
MRREPFPEILWDWDQRGKPIQLLSVYQKGIEEAIARNRYPLYQLEDIKSYPEFISSAIAGLKFLWLSLRFSLDRGELLNNSTFSPYENVSILIDSIKGKTIDISNESKLYILKLIPYKINCDLLIDNQPFNIGIFTSRKADMIQELTHSLECFEKLMN